MLTHGGDALGDMCRAQPPAEYGSRAMVEVVFPSAYRFLKDDVTRVLGVDVCGLLWPDAVAAACPELRATVGWGRPHNSQLVLRNPTLLPLQAAGLVVGLAGALALLARRSPSSRGAWACAFAWFAAMNATSVMVRSLCRMQTPASVLSCASACIHPAGAHTRVCATKIAHAPLP